MGSRKPRPASASASAESLLSEGKALHAKGQLSDAEKRYRAALAANPQDVDALQLLGVSLFQMGRASQAMDLVRRALAIDPRHLGALVNWGTILRASGQLGASRDAFQEAARLHSNSCEAWNGLGFVLLEMAQVDQAIEALSSAVRAGPSDGGAWLNYGNALLAGGRIDEAAEAFGSATTFDASSVEALNNLGTALLRLGKVAEAVDALRRALNLSPRSFEAACNFSAALLAASSFEEAADAARYAAKLYPTRPEAPFALGNALRELARYGEAIEAYEVSIAASREFSDALSAKAKVLQDAGNWENARECLPLGPGSSSGLRFQRALTFPVILDDLRQIDSIREGIRREIAELRMEGVMLADPLREVGVNSFYLAYHGLSDLEPQADIAQAYLQACPRLGSEAPHCRDRLPRSRHGKIRVGFVSAFLRSHTIGKLFASLVRELDRSKFEVVFCQVFGRHDALTAETAKSADGHLRLSGDLWQAQAQIAGAELDIAFFPEIGMDPATYYLAFARSAPVQAALWGHPMTTGIPNMDYFVSSRALEGEGSQAQYSERLAVLPDLTTCYARPAAPSSARGRAHFGLPDDARLYACPQTLFKFHPGQDEVFAEILRRDPTALLVLIAAKQPEWEARLRARWARSTPDVAGRIVFLPQMSLEEYLSLLIVADAVLDPIWFGGGNSSMEAFAVGAPVVTWPLDMLRNRITFACYSKMGMLDLCASDAESYIETALRLANDLDWHAEMSRRVSDSCGILFDDREPVRQLERFFVDAVAAAD